MLTGTIANALFTRACLKVHPSAQRVPNPTGIPPSLMKSRLCQVLSEEPTSKVRLSNVEHAGNISAMTGPIAFQHQGWLIH